VRNPSVSLILALGNEENPTARVQEALQCFHALRLGGEIVAVGGGPEAAEAGQGIKGSRGSPRVPVLQIPEGADPSEGLWRALRAASSGWCLFLPSRGGFQASEIRELLQHSRRADVMVSRRERVGESRSPGFLAQIAHGLRHGLMKRVLGLDIRDFESAVMVRKNVIQAIGAKGDTQNLFLPTEILYRALHQGFKAIEIPVSFLQPEEGAGSGRGKQAGLRRVLDFVSMVIRLRMSWDLEQGKAIGARLSALGWEALGRLKVLIPAVLLWLAGMMFHRENMAFLALVFMTLGVLFFFGALGASSKEAFVLERKEIKPAGLGWSLLGLVLAVLAFMAVRTVWLEHRDLTQTLSVIFIAGGLLALFQARKTQDPETEAAAYLAATGTSEAEDHPTVFRPSPVLGKWLGRFLVLALLACLVAGGTILVRKAARLRSEKGNVAFNYTSDPGESGGLPYFDETGRQLSDGVLGKDDWSLNLGRGPAYEWVGWSIAEPVITLDLGRELSVSSVRVYCNNFQKDTGVFLPQSISVAIGKDPTNLGSKEIFPVEPDTNDKARWVRLDLGGIRARFLSLQLRDNIPGRWIFVSEIQVKGSGSSEAEG